MFHRSEILAVSKTHSISALLAPNMAPLLEAPLHGTSMFRDTNSPVQWEPDSMSWVVPEVITWDKCTLLKMEYNKPVAIIFLLFFLCWHQGDGHLKPEVRTCRENEIVTKGACEIYLYLFSQAALLLMFISHFPKKGRIVEQIMFLEQFTV